MNEKVNFEKRSKVKSALLKVGVVVVGLLGLSGFVNALPSIFWRNESGTLTDLGGGEIKQTFTAGENVVKGEVCYLKSDGKVWKAKGDAEATSKNLIVMALGSISANASGVFLVRGNYTSSSLTVGEYYISVSTAGAIVTTRPSTSTNIVRIIGNATSATNLYFDPDKTYVQVV